MSASTVDANVLVHASDTSSPFRGRAVELIERLVRGPDLFYVFWPVLMAYLRISTHPAIFADPLSPEEATGNVKRILAVPHVRAPGEAEGFWEVFRAATEGMAVRGNLVPDAHLVALMRQHGVATIWTHDRDLRRFDAIRPRDPYV